MHTIKTKKISAIFRDEKTMEQAISHLTEETLALHEISVQASPAELKSSYGKSFVSPEVLQKDSPNTPKQEPFMRDDYGWLLGFSFSIPFILCIIVGLFAGGDLTDYHDNLIYALIGAIIGGGIGYYFMQQVKKKRNTTLKKQESIGGFVLWAMSTVDEQDQKIIAIFQQHGGENISIHE